MRTASGQVRDPDVNRQTFNSRYLFKLLFFLWNIFNVLGLLFFKSKLV